ncbi:DNA alkylation repair enzyme [Leptospira fainei serovar Hurstbridge str. BUT 6]|uniref:DNA alkylation repair enzyme n=1 Tax=Leptospira fainei serovar Hurstbridge str. BUT 6 TaxID=1193011 RepID=S3UUG1_9LEPT|nr:DNA alkylation repair protein [Leptospira fainei]EPG74036.1 DNA alkylation repair enzyme [Leptospira fainei serovar Hurstbridge str. BUT 6]
MPTKKKRAKERDKIRTGIGTKASEISQELQKLADPAKAKILAGFFKTAPGQYGAGDVFLGIQVPSLRTISKKHRGLPLKEVQILVRSKFHEERLTGFFILCETFSKTEEINRKQLHDFYLKNLKYVNNWDLVDLSARTMIGEYLADKDRSLLYGLAKSKNLWERRIAIISTYAFIREGDFSDAIRISRILLNDSEDLIHKAVGWMLREVGNRNLQTEIKFLNQNAGSMPRTMLRYAIEKFPEPLRKKYLAFGK